MSDVHGLIGLIRADIEQAADSMLSAAEMGLRDLEAVRQGNDAALDRLERTLCAILEACAFQDLAGQRLARLSAAVKAGSLVPPPADLLLSGPAAPGEGLDQAGADALLMDSHEPPGP